jgi:hypothetical protein
MDFMWNERYSRVAFWDVTPWNLVEIYWHFVRKRRMFPTRNLFATMLVLPFVTEDGNSELLRRVHAFLPVYTVSHPIIQYVFHIKFSGHIKSLPASYICALWWQRLWFVVLGPPCSCRRLLSHGAGGWKRPVERCGDIAASCLVLQ